MPGPLALGHIGEHQPPTGPQHATKLGQGSRDLIARQQVEHVAVHHQVEALTLERERERIPPAQLDPIEPCPCQASARDGQHAVGEIHSHGAPAVITPGERSELLTCSDGHLQDRLAITDPRDLQHEATSLALGESRPQLVDRGDTRVEAQVPVPIPAHLPDRRAPVTLPRLSGRRIAHRRARLVLVAELYLRRAFLALAAGLCLAPARNSPVIRSPRRPIIAGGAGAASRLADLTPPVPIHERV
jgi:hypothetical protein